MTTIKIHNSETGEVIERQMTEEELTRFENQIRNEAAAKAEATAKRQALLERLGITEDEAKLLLA
jgi:hypothetical protein